MVASSRAVRVEVVLLDAVLDEVLARGTVGLDRPGGRDVVGRDRVAELRENAGTGDVGDRSRLDRHAVEVRGLAHVGRIRVPLEDLRVGRRQRTPALVTVEHSGVLVVEHVGRDRRVDRGLHLGGFGPDVFQEDVLTVLVLAEGVDLEVEVHRPRQGVGDDERRAREVVHLHVGVDAALEVAVAREHRGHREVVLVDRGRDLVDQRTRVADAGRAAIADGVEAEGFEVVGETGLRVVVGDDLRSGRQRGLDPRLRLQPLEVRVAREQPAASITLGFDVLVHDVMAAIATAPWSSV